MNFPFIGTVGEANHVVEYNYTHYRYVDTPDEVFPFKGDNYDGCFRWGQSDITPIERFTPTLMEECEYSLDNENWFPCTVVNFKPLIVYTPNDKEVTMISDSVIAPSGIKFREKKKDERQEFIDKTSLIVKDHIYDECIADALWEAGYRLPTTNK